MPRNPFTEDAEDLKSRYLYLMVVVIAIFFLLLLRVWHLQIIRGHEFRTQSESNRTRVQETMPPRGMVLDRSGMILADNYPSYEVVVIREDVRNESALITRLATILGLPPEEIKQKYDAVKLRPSFQPAVLLANLTHENMVAVETHRFELPGVSIQIKPRRRYPHDGLAPHLIGYMSEVTQQQLDQEKYDEHRMGDQAGQMGVERLYESHLHGTRGRKLVEVEASGRVVKVLREIESNPGRNLVLTVDARLQKICEDIMKNEAGAIAAVDPATGEILAMASSPTFSQNDFIDGIAPEKWQMLLDNPLHPLENRPISGQYPPGSTFKIVVAAAALEEGVISPTEKISCHGSMTLGDRVFHCWNRSGHGATDLRRAIKESCDVYFYEVGLRLGVDKLGQYARAFGLGQSTDLGLPNEKEGVVPDKAWKKKRFKQPWRQGETLSVAIGQGYYLATPLQMAQVTATISNGGTLFQSQIVHHVTDADGNVVQPFKPEVVRRLNLKPDTIKIIKEALTAVVNEPGGTGKAARLEDVVVGGKTGTSQVVTLRKFPSGKNEDRPYQYRDHAWFVAFAPADRPRIALAVILEHAGGGGAEAAPLAQKVLDAYFHPQKLSRLDGVFVESAASPAG